MIRHEWRATQEDGATRLYRLTFDRSQWRLRSRLKREEEWQDHQPLSRAEAEAAREVVWNKYQRKRGAWKYVDSLDALVERLGGERLVKDP
ncbi:MAG: hypothetical protein AAF555_06560 [Verrucomicrobiota bacterium]